MADKTVWTWIMLLVIGVAGCEKSEPANRSATAGKEQPAQNQKAPQQKKDLSYSEDHITYSVSRTRDIPADKWPAEIKLPLIINIETFEVPKEIQGPSPPIEEEPIEEESKPIENEKE
jgi:hypothetical protein